MRAIGDVLENWILKLLGPGFHKTGNSGATFSDGDIRHPRLVIECKVKHTTEKFVAPTKDLRKLKKLAVKQGKDWIYIEENSLGEVQVLMDFNTFLELSDEWRKQHSKS